MKALYFSPINRTSTPVKVLASYEDGTFDVDVGPGLGLKYRVSVKKPSEPEPFVTLNGQRHPAPYLVEVSE